MNDIDAEKLEVMKDLDFNRWGGSQQDAGYSSGEISESSTIHQEEAQTQAEPTREIPEQVVEEPVAASEEPAQEPVAEEPVAASEEPAQEPVAEEPVAASEEKEKVHSEEEIRKKLDDSM